MYTDVFNAAGNFYGSGLPAGTGVITTVNANGDSCDAYGNVIIEPLFVDPFAWDFNLQSTSPCIDAGDPNLPRDPDTTVTDMGAFFFNQGTGVTPGLTGRVEAFRLHGAYPNPFNPTTAISYELRAASHVGLWVYDTAGREVATLVNGWRTAGSHEVTFDGSDLPSGVYLLRLEVSGLRQPRLQEVRKLILLK